MTKLNLLLLTTLLFSSCSTTNPSAFAEFPTNTPAESARTERVSLTDPATDRAYPISIKLPPNYSEDEQYPVVFMTDANPHMEILSDSTQIPQGTGPLTDVILVGIGWEEGITPRESRSRDYTPIHDVEWKVDTGGAPNHLAFIREQVIPYIATTVPTPPVEPTLATLSAVSSVPTFCSLSPIPSPTISSAVRPSGMTTNTCSATKKKLRAT